MLMRFLGLLVLSLFIAVFPAYSAVYQVTVSGHILEEDGGLDFEDDIGLFPPLEAYHDQPFSATFLIDDSVPGAQYSISAAGGSATGGPAYGIKSASPLTASITINGGTYDFNIHRFAGGDSGKALLNLDPPAGTSPFLSLDIQHVLRSYYPNSSPSNHGFYSFMDFNLKLPDTTQIGDFSSPDSIDIVNNSFGYFQVQGNDGDPVDGSGIPSFTSAYLVADHLTFGPAVPEAGTWAMMILGLGMVGASMRGRPRVAARMMA